MKRIIIIVLIVSIFLFGTWSWAAVIGGGEKDNDGKTREDLPLIIEDDCNNSPMSNSNQAPVRKIKVEFIIHKNSFIKPKFKIVVTAQCDGQGYIPINDFLDKFNQAESSFILSKYLSLGWRYHVVIRDEKDNCVFKGIFIVEASGNLININVSNFNCYKVINLNNNN